MKVANVSHPRYPRVAWALGTALVCVGCSTFQAREHNAVGVSLFKEGLYPAAQISFQEALYHDPENPNLYYNLASALHRVGDFDQAEYYYNLCLDRDPAHRRSYHALAVLLLEDGRREDALSLLQGWAEDAPWTPEASVELAWLSRHVGDVASAERQLQHALEVSPLHAEALAMLGSVREQAGDSDRALALYERSLSSGAYQPAVASRIANLRSGGAPLGSSDSRMVRRDEPAPAPAASPTRTASSTATPSQPSSRWAPAAPTRAVPSTTR